MCADRKMGLGSGIPPYPLPPPDKHFDCRQCFFSCLKMYIKVEVFFLGGGGGMRVDPISHPNAPRVGVNSKTILMTSLPCFYNFALLLNMLLFLPRRCHNRTIIQKTIQNHTRHDLEILFYRIAHYYGWFKRHLKEQVKKLLTSYL